MTSAHGEGGSLTAVPWNQCNKNSNWTPRLSELDQVQFMPELRLYQIRIIHCSLAVMWKRKHYMSVKMYELTNA